MTKPAGNGSEIVFTGPRRVEVLHDLDERGRYVLMRGHKPSGELTVSDTGYVITLRGHWRHDAVSAALADVAEYEAVDDASPTEH